MRKYFLSVFLFVSISCSCQDSLYVASERPAINDPAIAPVTVGEQITVQAGTFKAIKFYKNETAGTYVVKIWNPANGVSLFSASYKSPSTGWQKVDCNLSVTAGSYVISVYYPNGRYSYTNTWNPRTRGKMTGVTGLYSGGDFIPTKPMTAGFFVDAVITYPSAVPLSVSIIQDSIAVIMPIDSVIFKGVVAGATSYKWTVEDSLYYGKYKFSGLNTLTPTVKALTQNGGGALLVLTATDAAGNELSAVATVFFAPNPLLIRGYILQGDVIQWVKQPIYE